MERALVIVEENHILIGELMHREGELTVNPLRVLLAEEEGIGQGVGDSLMSLEAGFGVPKEEGGNLESWKFSCLEKFCHCLGMPTEGFEGEILKLLRRMRESSSLRR